MEAYEGKNNDLIVNSDLILEQYENAHEYIKQADGTVIEIQIKRKNEKDFEKETLLE